jgi:hypothetical protein
MNNSEIYKRGQVEWALWRFFLQGRQADPTPPKVFLTRVKRLLELDRGEDLTGKSKVPHARFAFADVPREGKGIDVGYRPFDAFCLALALDLLDIGFKQAEIVFLLRHIRDELETRFEEILRSPPPQARQRVFPKHRPDSPTYDDDRGHKFADPRIFVVIGKVEIKEIFQAPGRKSPSAPLIRQPVYCRGINELRDEFHRMGASDRKAVVIEIAEAAAGINRLLPQAPTTKRGRG